jgi:hypothetical protein
MIKASRGTLAIVTDINAMHVQKLQLRSLGLEEDYNSTLVLRLVTNSIVFLTMYVLRHIFLVLVDITIQS